MLNGDLGEVTDDVFHLGIAAATALAAEVVQPFDLIHQIINDGDDDLEEAQDISNTVDCE